MKRLFAAIALLSVAYSSQAGPKKYTPPYAISENQELPRSVFVSYRNQRHAFRDTFDSSQNYIALNGEWSFRQFSSATAIPGQAFEGGETLEKFINGWQQITLPGAWELAGQGGVGRAIYADKAYDFAKTKSQVDPPHLPGSSPVGVYVRKLTVPFDLFDKAHFLHIGAAKMGTRVYVNGKEVGFSAVDSKSPAEFDISRYITEGRNWIVLVVPQFTPGSYLEDWQGWRLSGINRDMFVFAQPKIRMRDYLVQTTLDPSYTNGLLETALLLKTQLLNAHTVTVHYDLYDPQGKLVNQNFRDVEVGLRAEDTVRFTASIPNVVKWDAEQPNLYTILYRIKREGRFTEYVACRVGFRTVEAREGGAFLVNGKPVLFKGVNLAEHMPATGNVLDTAQLRNMLVDMKLAGVNAVRTDGYPLPYGFYQLCDELGFYVCDVADINTAGLGGSRARNGNITNDPAWREAYLARVEAMYERDKNHPSVVMWALGDRSGNGYNMYQAYLMLKRKESTRPIVYNGAGMEWNTDVYCPDYPESLENTSGRPFVPSRVKFDPVYWITPGMQGAFLERWNDPSLTATVGPDGKYILSDDYKLTPSDGRIALSATGANAQVRTLFANVVITQVDASKGIYKFENRLQFTDLERFTVSYRLASIADGKVIREGIVSVAAAPGETAQVEIPGIGALGKDRKLTITVGNICRQVF